MLLYGQACMTTYFSRSLFSLSTSFVLITLGDVRLDILETRAQALGLCHACLGSHEVDVHPQRLAFAATDTATATAGEGLEQYYDYNSQVMLNYVNFILIGTS